MCFVSHLSLVSNISVLLSLCIRLATSNKGCGTTWQKKTVTWTKVMPSCFLVSMHYGEAYSFIIIEEKKDKQGGRKVPTNPTTTTNTNSTWVHAKGTEQLPTLWLFLTKHYGTRPTEVGASIGESKPADPPESQCNYHVIIWLTRGLNKFNWCTIVTIKTLMQQWQGS